MKDEVGVCCSLTFTLFTRFYSLPLVTLLVHIYLDGVVVGGILATFFHRSLVLQNCH